MNSNNRIASTLYSLGTYLSQEYKYKYPHKGDDGNDDDDDNNNNNNNL